MSSKKNNFGQAMYEMFGVGKDQNAQPAGEPEQEQEQEEPRPEESRDLPDEPMDFRGTPEPEAFGGEPSDFPEELAGEPSLLEEEPAGMGAFLHEVDTAGMDAFRHVVDTAVPVHTYQGTYLAAGSMMQGTLTARGDVEIAGDFEGEIVAKGKVTLHSNISSKISATGLALVSCALTGDSEVSGDVNVDEQSIITGNVKAENLVCSGKIIGDLDIQDNLVLGEFAHVNGSIKVDTMSIARGAKITGKIEMRNLKT